MWIQPTSCAEVGTRRQLIDMEQGFQPFEREFDLPPKPVCGEYLHGRVVLGWQRGAKDQKLRGDQRARIEHFLFAVGLRVQRLARGLHGLGRLAQDDQADRRGHTAPDQSLNVDLVRQMVVRQGREVIDQVERGAILAGEMEAVPLDPHDQISLAAAVAAMEKLRAVMVSPFGPD